MYALHSWILKRENIWSSALPVVIGSLFLALMAQISIPLPFTPVPLSMQPLAVFLLVAALGRKAPYAIACYLLEATVGLPVLAKGVLNPLWIVGPTAGYLIGFFLTAVILSRLLEISKSSFIARLCVFAVGEGIILSCGFIWLAVLFGFEKAFYLGVLPFLPGGALKVVLAAASVNSIRRFIPK